MVPRSAGRFESRQRLSLSRHRFFDPVSLQGLVWGGRGAGQAWVSKRVSLCRDRVFPRWDIPVATEDSMSQQGLQGWCCDRVFFCRDPKTRPERTTGLGMHISARTSGDAARTIEPPACTVCETARMTVKIETSLSQQTCPVANSALCCAMFELLFMDTIQKKKTPKIWGVTPLSLSFSLFRTQ